MAEGATTKLFESDKIIKVGRLEWFIAVCLVLCLAVPFASAQTPSDSEQDGLVGRVRSIRAESVSVTRVGTKLTEEGKRRPMDTVTFDEVGNYTLREVIDDYGFAVGKQTYKYEGKRIVEDVLVDTKGDLLMRAGYTYDKRGLIETKTISGGDGGGYTERYQYSSTGQLEQVTYVDRGVDVARTVFKYKDGQPTEIAYFDAKGKAATAPVGPCLGAHRVVDQYEKGRIQQRSLYEEDGSLKRRSSYKYDNKGNAVEEARTGASGEDRFTSEYEYDARGNWTRQIRTVEYDVKNKNGIPSVPLVIVTYRTITYY